MNKAVSDVRECMDEVEIERSLSRIAHQILEHNKGCENIAIVGIVTRGDILAKKLAQKIFDIEGESPPIGRLDISLYRDDFLSHICAEVHSTFLPFDLDGKNIILVDDVLYTGRTVRAALEAIIDSVRPASIQLAVLVDRGHKELPIKADFVGKNIPSSKTENIRLYLKEVDGRSCVELSQIEFGDRAGSAPLGGK